MSRNIVYKNIFETAFKEDFVLSDYYINCINDTNLIYIYNKKIYIRNLITDTITIKNINFEYHIIYKIYVSDDLNHIFLLYSKNIVDNEFRWIANINDDEIMHYEFKSVNNMCIYNNYIIVSDTKNFILTVMDFYGNIIAEYNDIYIINITKSNNYIIVSNMISFAPHMTNIILMKLDKNKLIIDREFIHKSCATFSKDEKTFYIYDDDKEELYLYETDNWTIIKTISTKLNEDTFWYKNQHFNKICLLKNKYVMLGSFKKTEIWDIEYNKYIGTFSKRIYEYIISNDNNYIIAISETRYFVWELNYGKFEDYKILASDNKLNLPNEIWIMIENYINIIY